MPHLIIEYSRNLEDCLDEGKFVQNMASALIGTDVFRTGGVRVRAHGVDRHHVADGHEDNGFVAMTLRIAPGRTDQQKALLGERLLSSAKETLAAPIASGHLALSLEIQELDPQFRWNVNSIHDRLESD